MSKQSTYTHKLLVIAFFVITAIILLIKLGEHPVYLADESRVATNAYEMYMNGHPFVPTFKGCPSSGTPNYLYFYGCKWGARNSSVSMNLD